MAVNSTILRALTKRTFGEGKLAGNKSKSQIKATADLFETVVGAYYFECGFEALCKWVGEIYTPLVEAGTVTFLEQ